MNEQQPRQSPASNGEAVHGARAEEITPSVAGVRRKNNTAPERRSTRRRGGGLTPGCSTGPAAFNVAGGRNSIDLGPKDASWGTGIRTNNSFQRDYCRDGSSGHHGGHAIGRADHDGEEEVARLARH